MVPGLPSLGLSGEGETTTAEMLSFVSYRRALCPNPDTQSLEK